MTKKMVFFYSEKKENGYLSNWYPAEFNYDGYHYKTSEQYMMHQKALLFGDKAVAKKILKTEDQKEIKYLGREVTPFDNDTWNDNRVEIVYKGLLEKFRQNKNLKDMLLDTGDAIIVEAAPRDTQWGIGLGKDNPKAQDPKTWRGKNLLGYTLMRVRETIREEEGKDTVYVSKGGKKFHMPGCTYAKGGKKMKKKDALSQGMEPCGRCCF